MSTSNENRYSCCWKKHEIFGGENDGCQRYMQNPAEPLTCIVCGCHQGFHLKVTKIIRMAPLRYETKVVHTKCRRIHHPSVPDSVDGCQLFADGGIEGSVLCESCGCHKNFHRDEIRVPIWEEDS